MKDIQVIRKSVSEKSIINTLTNGEIKELDSEYIDLIGLINYIDNLIFHISELRNKKHPLQLVRDLADSREWPRR